MEIADIDKWPAQLHKHLEHSTETVLEEAKLHCADTRLHNTWDAKMENVCKSRNITDCSGGKQCDWVGASRTMRTSSRVNTGMRPASAWISSVVAKWNILRSLIDPDNTTTKLRKARAQAQRHGCRNTSRN